jgi:hypothetical protein
MGWRVTIVKNPDMIDGRFSAKDMFGRWTRPYHYKKDALEFYYEVLSNSGKVCVTPEHKMPDKHVDYYAVWAAGDTHYLVPFVGK